MLAPAPLNLSRKRTFVRGLALIGTSEKCR
jgi:hypothetical protein